MSQNLHNNTNSSKSLDCLPKADERAEILALLSPLDPQIRHQKLRNMRVDTVGDWFLETEEFRNWDDRSENGGSGSAVLFCRGDSGIGKTFISSLVIDKLYDQARRQSTVVCFYLDRASQEEQSPADVLGSLLKQLINGLDKIPKEVLDVFREEEMGVGGRILRFAQIEKLFRTITSSQRTIICVDGLDHCRVRDRLKLLSSLREILQKSPGTRLFLTGGSNIRSETEKELGEAATVVSITTTEDDVISYLHARLNEDPAPDAIDSILKADILNRITKNVPNVLGLVSIKIDEILRETTILGRRLRLNAMTESNLGPFSENSTPYPYSRCHTSCSQFIHTGSSNIDPRPEQNRSPSQYPHQICLTGMPQVASPGQLTPDVSSPAASSPASLNYQSAFSAGYTADCADGHFYFNPNYPHSASPQGWEISHQNLVNLFLSPLPPYQPTHQDIHTSLHPCLSDHPPTPPSKADHSGPGPYVCGCGTNFGRLTDLDRHLRTSKRHNKYPRGPACPVNSCHYTSRFTRVDNFKSHCMKQHGMSSDDADAFIREWNLIPLSPHAKITCNTHLPTSPFSKNSIGPK